MANDDLLVLCAASQERGFLGQLRDQLAAARIDFSIYPLTTQPPNGCGNLGWKVQLYRTLLRLAEGYHKLVICDAWDIHYFGQRDYTLATIPDEGVLVAAEREPWPDAYIKAYLPQHSVEDGREPVPWCCFNGGFTAGRPQEIARWLNQIEAEPSYHPAVIDQQWFNFLLMRRSPLVAGLDWRTRLCYCMMSEQGELQFKKGYPYNTLTGESPSFIHYCGKSHQMAYGVHVQRWLSLQQAKEAQQTEPVSAAKEESHVATTD